MKRMSKGIALALGMSMVLTTGVWAAEAGTYSDGVHDLVIAEDGRFTMEEIGQNMEGEEFVLLVTGVFAEDGSFTIDGLYDGEINLIEVASEEQLAGNIASVQAAFDGGAAGAEEEAEDDGLPGIYYDEEDDLTLEIGDDLRFIMEQVGQNMEGEEFVLIVTGIFEEDGTFTIDGLYDGEINLIEMASEEQLAGNIEQVQKAFDAGKVKEDEAEGLVAGTYSDGELELVLEEDGRFVMEKVGQNMEGEDFVMIVTGEIAEDGTITIDGLYDGEINLVEVASEEQLAADLATVESVLAGGLK